MLRKLIIAGAVAATAALSACATATPYQPAYVGAGRTGGGFAETQLEPNRWRVNFAGNSLTSRERVETYLLYRAAELTLSQGFDWFTAVDRGTDKQVRTYVDRDPFYGPRLGPWYGYGWHPRWRYYRRAYGWGHWDPFWGDPFWGDRYDVRTVEKYDATAEIVMGRGPKPMHDPQAFDAREVVRNLGPHIQRPQVS